MTERTDKQEAVMADEPGTKPEEKPDEEVEEEESSSQPADDVEAMKKALKKANKEAETARLKVKEYEDATKSEQEKLTESLTEAEKRAETASLTALRYEVALDKGIPKSIASRLQGTTREELETDAAELLETISGDKPTPSFDGGAKDKDAPTSGSFLTRAIRDTKRTA